MKRGFQLISSSGILVIQLPSSKADLIDLFHKTKANIVGFQETKKETISDNYLNSLVGNRMFYWNSLPVVGSTGGICVGVDIYLFDVISLDIKKFLVVVVAKIKTSGLILRIVTVYCSSYEDKKVDFISELYSLLIDYQGHSIIGGDFNLVTYHGDKSNGMTDHRWNDKFNAWVQIWSL
jgi:exonuclease III